jgi:hypothetical protein
MLALSLGRRIAGLGLERAKRGENAVKLVFFEVGRGRGCVGMFFFPFVGRSRKFLLFRSAASESIRVQALRPSYTFLRSLNDNPFQEQRKAHFPRGRRISASALERRCAT